MPMPPTVRVRGILFDLWNTLVYSDYRPAPMNMIAEALGIAERPDWRRTVEAGMMTRRHLGIREGLDALERYAGVRLTAEERGAIARRWNEACAATRLYDDAIETLRALRGRFRLGILSNTQSFDLEFLRSRGLEALMDGVCLSCDEGRLKPDPLFYAAGCAKLGLPPSEILMVGDRIEDDVVGALRAGLSALHLDRAGGAERVPGSAGTVRSLTEIPSIVL